MSKIVITFDETDTENLIAGKEVECDIDEIPSNFNGVIIKKDVFKTEDTTDTELRILRNYIRHMTKVYRQRSMNYIVVRDILLSGTSTSGQTSCIEKCHKLGIDPWGHTLESEEDNE